MADLHERYMDEPGPTDVLSFPLDEADGTGDGRRLLGDVVIAPAVAARNNPDDPAAELRLLLVHGILHLLGHDHEDGSGALRDVGAAGAVQRGARAVIWLWVLVAVLVILGSVLAVAEASLTRMTRVRALALVEEGRRNAVTLERIEADPPRFLNAIYLTVMLCQNGSAILVAILAERSYGGLGVTIVSVVFTLLYFVIVEAMSKTFGVLHSDRARPGGRAARVVPRPGARAAHPRADRPRERPAARAGASSRARSSRRRTCDRWPRSATRRARSSARRTS